MVRYLSGIQPSGTLHLGNYFGAIEQYLKIQNEGETFFFIADYHALTSVKDPDQLRRNTYETAATYLALGLDKACLFRQSDIPEVTELAWILSNSINVSHLQRSHAYKDKVDKGLPASAGLFTYPILMAADILIFQADAVPIGHDQIQHIEMVCDIAQSFNHTYGSVFKIPTYTLSTGAKVIGTDGNKMGKSYNNTIPILDSPKNIAKIVSQIKTDGKDYTKEPLTVEGEIVFHLYSLVASDDEIMIMKEKYINDRTFGYGHAKKLLTEKLVQKFGPLRTQFENYMASSDIVQNMLKRGADRARKIAQETMFEVRKAVGLR